MNIYQRAEFFTRPLEPAANKTHAEVHAAYIKIDEVSAIRLVQIIVAVDEIRTGRYDHGLEECCGTGFKGEGLWWKEVVAKQYT